MRCSLIIINIFKDFLWSFVNRKIVTCHVHEAVFVHIRLLVLHVVKTCLFCSLLVDFIQFLQILSYKCVFLNIFWFLNRFETMIGNSLQIFLFWYARQACNWCTAGLPLNLATLRHSVILNQNHLALIRWLLLWLIIRLHCWLYKSKSFLLRSDHLSVCQNTICSCLLPQNLQCLVHRDGFGDSWRNLFCLGFLWANIVFRITKFIRLICPTCKLHCVGSFLPVFCIWRLYLI